MLHINLTNAIGFILKIGSVAGLVSLFYTIKDHIRNKSSFSYDFAGTAGGAYEENGHRFAKFRWEGIIRNESVAENSIVRLDYVVWANKSRTRTKTQGMILDVSDPNLSQKIGIPINFGPKESKKVVLTAVVPLTGSHNESLFLARKPTQPGSMFFLPENQWDLLFMDVNHNSFDEKGSLRSQKLLDLWWVLPNATRKLDQGNPIPAIVHFCKIFWSYLCLQTRKLFRILGL